MKTNKHIKRKSTRKHKQYLEEDCSKEQGYKTIIQHNKGIRKKQYVYVYTKRNEERKKKTNMTSRRWRTEKRGNEYLVACKPAGVGFRG